MAKISDDVRKIFSKKVFAHVATLMPDGSPQVSPVWVETDNDQIVFNTAEGRVKPENLERDGRIAISVVDPDDPYSAVLIQGEVDKITDEGAEEHVDSLAKKYLDEDEYPHRKSGEKRLIVRVNPTNITTDF